MEFISLVDSHEALISITNNSDLNEKEAFVEYLKQTRFPPIKDFEKGLQWFNVQKPLSFAEELKGKLVLLDFFTYCCINCMHILPGLKAIEKEFSVEDGLVVIGVHSAKFENERDSQNVLSAVQRYNITHPVVNDLKSTMWNQCEVICWPTLILLGPSGKPILMLMGEGHTEKLKIYIRIALEFFKKEISRDKIPIDVKFNPEKISNSPLLFPGKITNTFDEEGNEIFAVSDSGNHRILIMNNSGIEIFRIGISEGFEDGDFTRAKFRSPQGLTFGNCSILYVADTENHAIRLINLIKRTVSTIAGTGKQGDDKSGGKIGLEQELSSPWDLVLYKEKVLVIAMAGTHQIWALFLEDTVWWKNKKYEKGQCVAIAGSGHEENRNNSYPQKAAFAQPSGLALSPKREEVFIADSESSTVRKLSLIDGKVSAVVGGDRNPNNLFAYGDLDGTSFEAKLQHSLGLTLSKDENVVYVADTYNNKIKKIELSKNSISTMTSNATDTTDGLLKSLNEPSGLCLTGKGTLLITDTNNHCIKEVELDEQLNISKISVWQVKMASKKMAFNSEKYVVIENEKLKCKSDGTEVKIGVYIMFEKGLKLEEGSPTNYFVNLEDEKLWRSEPKISKEEFYVCFLVSKPKMLDNQKVEIGFDLITCTKDSCMPKNFILRFSIDFENKRSEENVFRILVTPDKINII